MPGEFGLSGTGQATGSVGTAAALLPIAMNHSSAQQRALKILAKSVYRELKASGYVRGDMIAFTTELLDLVTTEMKQDASEGSPLLGSDAEGDSART